jgi:uracil-DNA glycosylase
MFQYNHDPAPERAGNVPADTLSLVTQLQKPCAECRLGQLTDRQNNGFAYLGSLDASIAFLGDMPDIEGCSLTHRAPVAGRDLDELRRWWGAINNMSAGARLYTGQGETPCPDIAFENLLVLNVVQCKTMKGKVAKDAIRSPYPEEIDRCFPFRALPVLKSMRNLKCVITLGWTAAAALLGRAPEPKPRSHEGCWFGTELLPGVAVFCLDHVREYESVGMQKVDPKKIGRLMQHLNYLHNELINPSSQKVLKCLALLEGERRG